MPESNLHRSWALSVAVALALASFVPSAGAQGPTPPPQTIGDVIRAKETADQTATQAADAAAKANQSLTDALATQKGANAELKKDLAVTGPVFVQLPDGTITIYIPEVSDDGFHVLKPVPVTTPVNPPAPAPTPTPAPTPAPVNP